MADENQNTAPEETAETTAPFDAEAAKAAEHGTEIPSFLNNAAASDAAPASSAAAEKPAPSVNVTSVSAVSSEATAEDAATEDEPEITAEPAEDSFGHKASAAASAFSSFMKKGANDLRDVNAANKALSEAKSELKELEARIKANSDDLDHRKDIEDRYASIVDDGKAAIEKAGQAIKAAQDQSNAIQGKIDELKTQLSQMHESDTQNERKLKQAVEEAEAKESVSRETGSRLTRRVDDAQRLLDKAQSKHQSGVAEAQEAINQAKSKLDSLQSEQAELQRTPSANSANYSVRMQELETEIANTTAQLQEAKENLPKVTSELTENLETAKKALASAQEPIEEARRTHKANTDAADAARAAYQQAKSEAAERQRQLKDQISEQEKAQREQDKLAQQAQSDMNEAQETIDEAEDIHAHPELTQAIEAELAGDKKDREDRLVEIDRLHETASQLKENTRGSRYKFIAVLAAFAVLIVIIIAIWIIATHH